MEDIQYSGDTLSTVGDDISTVEVVYYSGDKDLKYSKNLKNFSSLRNQIDHITDLNC